MTEWHFVIGLDTVVPGWLYLPERNSGEPPNLLVLPYSTNAILAYQGAFIGPTSKT
jgi:hypothetical protein